MRISLLPTLYKKFRKREEACSKLFAFSTSYPFHLSSITTFITCPLSLSPSPYATQVTDPDEAWMFHILTDDTGASAVWVAQRVPDDHVTAVANSFVIGDVDPSSPDFLYSSNLWAVAERLGWWKKSKATPLLNFKMVYGPERLHPYYSHRRVWRIFDLAAPSLKLSPYTDAFSSSYPFSVKVERVSRTYRPNETPKVIVDTLTDSYPDSVLPGVVHPNPRAGLFSVRDIMWINRDHFEGTPYDTSVGISAGKLCVYAYMRIGV